MNDSQKNLDSLFIFIDLVKRRLCLDLSVGHFVCLYLSQDHGYTPLSIFWTFEINILGTKADFNVLGFEMAAVS